MLTVEALITTCFILISCVAYSVTMKMKATYSSIKSADFQRTAQRYTPEDKIVKNIFKENYSSDLNTVGRSVKIT